VKLLTEERLPGLARLELLRGDMPIEEAYCDSRGQHTFYGLADGSYSVRVYLPGFQVQQHDVQLGGDASAFVVAHLRPGDNEEVRRLSAPDDPTVSVRWLAAPEKAREEIGKARERRLRQDFKGAIKHAERALKVAPDFVLAHNELGLCFQGQKKLDKARKAFETAIELDPDFLLPYLNLAEAWAQKKEYNRAGQLLMQASQAHPDRGEPYFAMAKIQLDTGHAERAEQACLLALARDHSRIPGVHLLLANIYMRRGDEEQYIAALEAYLAQAPDGEQSDAVRTRLEDVRVSQRQTQDVPSEP
jgi:tetratricopeptide (TPR) repeat protein